MATDPTPAAERVSLVQIRELMRLLLSVPRAWLAGVVLAVAASLFHISRAADGAFTVEFRVTTTTTLLLALAWLPALLAVLAVAGGGVKTPAGEATTGGLLQVLQNLDRTTKKTVLPSLVASLEQAETTVSPRDRYQVRELRQVVEGQLASLPIDAQQARVELDQLAEDYETIRATQPSGEARMFRMGEVVARARALAIQAHLTPAELAERCAAFAKASPGQRIITLSLIEALDRGAKCFSAALDAIRNSQSAFEQFRGLRLAERMVPHLDTGQRDQLMAALDEQRAPGGYITMDSDRRPIAENIAHAIMMTRP